MHQRITCTVCGKAFDPASVRSWGSVRPGVSRLISADHPGWVEGAHICKRDLGAYRTAYVESLLEEERGKLSDLDRQVIDAIEANETISINPEELVERSASFGDRIADRVADFGGSWTFIISFLVILLVWIGLNVVGLFAQPFDPYPFILLNLVLSTLAALQAPVIMMSQKRQDQKDRLRAENDYRINLKAELEIRQLHEKIDHQLTRQWEKLAELQQIQIDFLEETARDRRKS